MAPGCRRKRITRDLPAPHGPAGLRRAKCSQQGEILGIKQPHVLTITDDAVADGGETIILDAASTDPALTAPTLTLTITDNEVPVPALPVGGALLLGLLLLWRGAARVRQLDEGRA